MVEIAVAMTRLNGLKGLTRLDVRAQASTEVVCLTWMTKCLSKLKLKILNIELPKIYKGNLENLEGLEEFFGNTGRSTLLLERNIRLIRYADSVRRHSDSNQTELGQPSDTQIS